MLLKDHSTVREWTLRAGGEAGTPIWVLLSKRDVENKTEAAEAGSGWIQAVCGDRAIDANGWDAGKEGKDSVLKVYDLSNLVGGGALHCHRETCGKSRSVEGKTRVALDIKFRHLSEDVTRWV